MQKQKGFSLIELLITLAIFSIVVVFAVNLFINSVSSNREYREKKQDQEIINVVSDIMYRDIVEAELEKTRIECETGYIISLYIGGICNYYYIENVKGNFVFKYMKDDKSFTLAENLPNENAVKVTESSDGFFIIEVSITKDKDNIVFHAYNKNKFHE